MSANIFVVFKQGGQTVGNWYTYHVLCLDSFHSSNPTEKNYMPRNNTLSYDSSIAVVFNYVA